MSVATRATYCVLPGLTMFVRQLRRAQFLQHARRLLSTERPSSTFPVWRSAGVFLATGIGLWLYYRGERQKMLTKREVEAASAVGTPSIGGPFQLTDADGQPFSDANLAGKYYLLYFGFTHCPDICPQELDKIAQVVRIVRDQVPQTPLVPVFITCDPERDTPAAIKSYLKDFGPDFVGLTGSVDAVRTVAKTFRVYYRAAQTSSTGDYLVDHSVFFYLMGPDGKFRTNFGRESSAESCARTILEEMQRV